jgi:hypothetical protein
MHDVAALESASRGTKEETSEALCFLMMVIGSNGQGIPRRKGHKGVLRMLYRACQRVLCARKHMPIIQHGAGCFALAPAAAAAPASAHQQFAPCAALSPW